MPDHANRAWREIQILGGRRGVAIRVLAERQAEPPPLREATQTRRDAWPIERRQRRRRRVNGRVEEACCQRLSSARNPTLRVAHQPAGSQNKRSNQLQLL